MELNHRHTDFQKENLILHPMQAAYLSRYSEESIGKGVPVEVLAYVKPIGKLIQNQSSERD